MSTSDIRIDRVWKQYRTTAGQSCTPNRPFKRQVLVPHEWDVKHADDDPARC